MNEDLTQEVRKAMAEHADFRVAILEMQRALYGDPKNGDIGVVKKIDEMYVVFSGLGFIGKIATWLAIILAGVGSVWGGIFHFIKGLK